MKRAAIPMVALTLASFSAVGADGQTTTPPSPQAKVKAPPIIRTQRNTFVYNHLQLRSATDAPYALEIGDGDLFQVVIQSTDPTLFRYSISAVPTDQTPPTSSTGVDSEGILANPVGQASLTMRHDQHFVKYRVTIAAINGAAEAPARTPTTTPSRPGEQILGEQRPSTGAGVAAGQLALFPVSFDLWVMARPEWKVSFSGGVSFSNLTDQKFYIKTDAAGKKTVEEDLNTRDSVRHDIVALANVYFDHAYLRSLIYGVAFGLGDNGGSNPHYFVGPSVVLGKNFIFTAGMAFGSVATLPAGQDLHQAPINGDNTLTTPGSHYQKGFFAGVAFAFVPKESEFKGGFSSTTVTAPAIGGAGPALTVADLPGDYLNGTVKETVALGAKKDGKDTLTVTLDDTNKAKNNNSATLQLDVQVSPSDFKSTDNKNEVKFTRDPSGIIMEWLQDGKAVLKATKKTVAKATN